MATLFRIFVVLILSLIVVSCVKDEPEPEDPGPATPVNTDPPYFRWSTSAHNLIEADSAHAYVNSNVIFAFKSGSGLSLEVRLSDMATGTYPVSSASGNQLEYQSGTTIYNGSGTFNITESVSNKMSGNFTCTLTGGTLTSISGTFAAIPKRFN